MRNTYTPVFGQPVGPQKVSRFFKMLKLDFFVYFSFLGNIENTYTPLFGQPVNPRKVSSFPKNFFDIV